MRLFKPILAALFLPLIFAQDNNNNNNANNDDQPSSSRSGTITSSPSGSASASRSGSGSSNSTSRSTTTSFNITTLTTSLTVYPTSTPSGVKVEPTTLALTFTMNTTDLNEGGAFSATNASIWNGTLTNGTIPFDGENKPWEEGDSWLPFKIRIDPAYGVLGALLIVSGIPVAVLGGKNRWSSLAISTGYAVMLLTLVLILRWGVQPNLQPPSPSPPSTTLRGLYLLACVIASFFGAALGIFLYTFAKYWVSAIGGFTFGWFLLATRQGGLITSVLGRWGLLGGLTVAAFVGSLPKFSNEWMMLVSTAWIGATAFTLGVDCYTRGGLKEFYMYNLGFKELFPKLNGFKYPLTQTMMIELGILAAMVVIGAAIQFRVLNILTKKLRQMREEEEAKIEAEEIEKAAERFKNVGAELSEWEDKHGNGHRKSGSPPPSSVPTDPYGSLAGSAKRVEHDHSSIMLPQLGFGQGSEDRRASSALSLLRDSDPKGLYESVALGSPGLPNPDTPSVGGLLGLEELKVGEPSSPTHSNPELESQMRLLDEIKKAREEIRGSLDRLSSNGTPAPSVRSDSMLLGRGTTPTPSLVTAGERRDRHTSTSTTDRRDRHLSSASSNILDLDFNKRERHMSATSGKILNLDFSDTPGPRALSPDEKKPAPSAPQSEWDAYLAQRKVVTQPLNPSPPPPPPPPVNMISVPASVARGISERRERTTSMLEHRVSDFGPRDSRQMGTYPTSYGTPGGGGSGQLQRNTSAGQDRPGSSYDNFGGSSQPLGSPIAVDRATSPRGYESRSRPVSQIPAPGPVSQYPASRPTSQQPPARQQASRPAMSIDELAERHRQRMSRMQDPVTSKMREEVEVEEARKKLERQKQAEKDEQKRQERERFARERERETGAGGQGRGKEEVLRNTDEWRRSVVLDAPPPPATASREREREKQRAKEKQRASRQFAS
ncbi:hypothetical protein I317_02591 [Kwoniella heveanensis CBS 569]|nr:hypothetical protein I317_02591 [Kwoniella heveanensis CBS 569]